MFSTMVLGSPNNVKREFLTLTDGEMEKNWYFDHQTFSGIP